MTELMIVGEAWGRQEEQEGKPFVGSSGWVLNSLLSQAGIERESCYVTNVFNFRPPNNSVLALCGPKTEAIPEYRPLQQGKYIRREFLPELERLSEEVSRVKPNLILALGNTALWALCKKSGIKKYRGSPLPTHDGRVKVIPSWHPAAIMRQWELRPVSLADFYKAKREMAFPELRRPNRQIYLQPTLDDIWDFYKEFLEPAPWISCDIETKQLSITEVGYATPDAERAIVIPFWSRAQKDGNYWRTLEEELAAWAMVRKINEVKAVIGQNFQYDMQYFWKTVGIPCPIWKGDTMLLHHALQPEMEKSLGFLGSVYTDEPSWKFMRTDHSTLKQGDD